MTGSRAVIWGKKLDRTCTAYSENACMIPVMATGKKW